MRATKVQRNRVEGGEVNGSTEVGPDHSWTSVWRKGWEVEEEAEYSPGRSRKKKASHIMSAVAKERGSPAVEARREARWRMDRGMGLTRMGGGSDFS